MRIDLRQAFDWLTEGVLLGTGAEPISRVSTDTRQVAAGDLFIALKGDRFDAHDFVGAALDAGAAAIVVERWTDRCRPPALWVPDTRRALGRIAAGWRTRFELPIVAVTGSNGKTTVKEMIASILVAHVGADAAFATRGNLNNDVGVPQTLLALGDAHRIAVVELGMNHPGEIGWLASLVRPSVALVNNAQREHQEFMAGPEATAVENGAVFDALPAGGVAVFPGDDPHAAIWRRLAGNRDTVEFGLVDVEDPAAAAGRPRAPLTVHADHRARPDGFAATIGQDTVTVRLAIAGRHNVRNALAAAACARALGIPAPTIAAGLAAFRPVAGRLCRLRATGGQVLIDDSYNANPDSVRAAIDVLADEPSPRLLVLGDMGEVGVQGPEFHREVGAYARERGIDRLLAVGDLAAEAAAAFGEGASHFGSVESLVDAVAGVATGFASVLVKGSRFMRMERIVKALSAVPVPEARH